MEKIKFSHKRASITELAENLDFGVRSSENSSDNSYGSEIMYP